MWIVEGYETALLHDGPPRCPNTRIGEMLASA
jgi:hypothetical protein